MPCQAADEPIPLKKQHLDSVTLRDMSACPTVPRKKVKASEEEADAKKASFGNMKGQWDAGGGSKAERVMASASVDAWELRLGLKCQL